MTQAPWTVMKFGGSSLATPDRIERVVGLVDAVARPAVVVSALSDTTDRLEAALAAAQRGDRAAFGAALDQLAARLAGVALDQAAALAVGGLLGSLRELLLGVSLLREVSGATRALVLSHGERIAAVVVASRLRARGRAACAVDARDWLVTDGRYDSARVDEVASDSQLAALSAGWGDAVPVVTGFIGATPEGRTTTLGRGGSDYTATLLGRGLGAAEVQIWSDVPGVMTADPALVDDARPLAKMSYGEALELALFGARVLHPRTLVPLLASGQPMRIKNTLRPEDPGTLVDRRGADDSSRATCVTSLEQMVLFDLRFQQLYHAQRVGERVHRALESASERIWLVTHSAHGQGIAATVAQEDAPAVLAALEAALEPEMRRGALEPIGVRDGMALLTLVGEAIGGTPNVAGRLFGALGAVGISVRAVGQSASARSISCVVDQDELATAVRTVHAAFHLTHQRVSLFVLGTGVVGGSLLSQLAGQQATLRDEHDVLPLLVGVATRSRLAFRPEGLDPSAWAGAAAPRTPAGFEATLDQLARLPTPILVDCTAAEGMEQLYEAAFRRGIHVVAANKKALTTPQATRDRLLAAARESHRAYRYETTVGAALPIITTLHDIVRTGDEVRRIEGSLSGTLGFLCDQLSQGVAIDAAVRDARERGYTEPRPQDDLSGTDVARKALILARELGLSLDLGDVAVEPLVPGALLDIDDVDDFLAALAEERGTVADRIEAARAEGRVLRYLAVIDPQQQPPLRVGPVAVGPEHPAHSLRGSQAMVALTTRRYPEYPLVVQGAGAGGEVTASGVLAEVLRIANGLRGR